MSKLQEALEEVRGKLQYVGDEITLKEAEVIRMRSEEIVLRDAEKKLLEVAELLEDYMPGDPDMDDTQELDATVVVQN